MPKTKITKRGQPAASETLKGWKAIGDYLGIGAAAAQRWAKSGMPVRREGRYTVADPEEVRKWLGKEAHMSAPATVVKDDADMSAALQESIREIRKDKKKR